MQNFFKALIVLVKRLPAIPLRSQLRQFYKKYIRERMYEKRKVFKKIDGIKHELDLSTYQGMEAYYGNWEPAVTRFIERCVKPRMIVMDIGASIGLHSFRMKKLVGDDGKVFAVDQKKYAADALKKTARLNNLPLVIDEVMLSDISEGREMKLDDYAKLKKINQLDFILMDLDGGEYRVFKGGEEVLKQFKPMIMFELHPSHLGQEGSERLFELLGRCGYFFDRSTIKEAIGKKTIRLFHDKTNYQIFQ